MLLATVKEPVPLRYVSAFSGERPPDDVSRLTIASNGANVNDITRFKIECLETIFKGGVLRKWLPLGRNNAHWYSLIFAMANPSTNAKKAGHAIANHIMTSS